MSTNNNIYTKKLSGRKPNRNHIADVRIMNGRVTAKVIEKRMTGIGNIRKFEKFRSVNIETGEIYEYTPESEENPKRKSFNNAFSNLRDLIQANFEGGENELHIVLTDGTEGMSLSAFCAEFKKFYKRLSDRYKSTEYIAIREMSQNYKWHIHLLLKGEKGKKLVIPNREIEQLWRWGWTKVQRINDIDNLLAYFILFQSKGETGGKTSSNNLKRKMKLKMLEFFPKGSKLYTSSKGIEEPLNLQTQVGKLDSNLKGVCSLEYSTVLGVMEKRNGIEKELNRIHYLEYRGMGSKEFLLSCIDVDGKHRKK